MTIPDPYPADWPPPIEMAGRYAMTAAAAVGRIRTEYTRPRPTRRAIRDAIDSAERNVRELAEWLEYLRGTTPR